MSKIRLVFLGLALVFGVPILLLVWRAFASIETEREIQHQAVADHSDGKTYGTVVGPLSTVSHTQMFVNFPIEGR